MKKPQTLVEAIPQLTIATQNAGYDIPSEIFPEEFKGRQLTTMKDVERIGDGKLGELDCYRVQGMKGFLTFTLWIDKSKSLVHRVDMKHSSGSEQTLIYNPIVNAEVPNEALGFNSPQH